MNEAVSWRPYDLSDDPTVVGDVRVSDRLTDERLESPRRLLASLPPSHRDSETEYPVLYMHDGLNLFDERTSYSGEWQVDETMERLSDEGIEAIVVGVPNADDSRATEYVPYQHDEREGGNADSYLSFLVERVKPLVDERFRTREGRDSTGIAGSSLGGLVSLYGFFEYPETFGFAGVMSPAFWWTDGEIFDYVRAQERVSGKLYVDVGGDERPDDPERSREYRADAERMVELLREKGYGESALRFVLEEGANHHESAWARRFPEMVRFLL